MLDLFSLLLDRLRNCLSNYLLLLDGLNLLLGYLLGLVHSKGTLHNRLELLNLFMGWGNLLGNRLSFTDFWCKLLSLDLGNFSVLERLLNLIDLLNQRLSGHLRHLLGLDYGLGFRRDSLLGNW